jgi:uroporphyrin-III C-methyltransferase
MIPGKVYLVGAGPGHPELLTIKAAELIKAADVLVYDRLIQEEVLALAKPSAERIYLGKPLRKHESRQDEIHQMLLRKAREGKLVVRLKGGDPFLFGRGGEEAEFLIDHGIPFEVIPGVTSALSAPLSAGIPVTHRQNASSVAIVTGHEAKDEETRLDWSALAKMETLVFLMSVKNAGKVATRLMENGRPPDTPAAMIQMAFWHDERVLSTTLEKLAEDVEREGIKPPATLVIGEVVRLGDKFRDLPRDLKRRADGSSRFQPAPAPDQLLRIATAGLGTQALGLALEIKLFDRLENPSTAEDLAEELGADPHGLSEILDSLQALGLLETTPEGFQNLEMASRYLRDESPQSLRPTLLHHARQSGPWNVLERYLREGRRDFVPPDEPSLLESSCEALAVFAAPAVADKLDLSRCGSVLHVGWGREAYREAIAERWPQLGFDHRNPFSGPDHSLKMLLTFVEEGNAYGAVLLSGLLACCNRGEVRRVLDKAAAALADGGILAIHDTLLPVNALPPPEVVLGGLGRHIHQGGCRTWSVERLEENLVQLGMGEVKVRVLPAATVLVTALKVPASAPTGSGQ